MFDANMARALTADVAQVHANEHVAAILKDVIDECTGSRGKTEIWYTMETDDKLVLVSVTQQLCGLGFSVDCQVDEEYHCAEITVRW